MHPIHSAELSQSSLAGEHSAFSFSMKLNAWVRNYNHVASLWAHESWLPEAAVQLARSHYAAYMVKRLDGLRIITLNTDLCKSTLISHSILFILTQMLGYRYVQQLSSQLHLI